jgi:hypothetical protein
VSSAHRAKCTLPAATSSQACSAGTKVSSYLYWLAPAGNRLSVTELSGRYVSYGYDPDYLLTLEAISSGGNTVSESYTYDVVGNRKTLNSTIPALPGNTTSSYDPNDFLTTDTPDANGNTTSWGECPTPTISRTG